ncbi:MAG: hypothetical protein KGI29_01675 [Pseudomonadota bacterium]|nr:hypothetical protein [Pseudomonadota bacterium]MDE3037745.1 hypothetical protein [Pseudomonadota bacterium]
MKNRIMFSVVTCWLALAGCSGAPQVTHKTLPPPIARLTLLPQGEMVRGKPVTVLMKLTAIKTRSLLTDADLETMYTKKIHLLLIDPSLADYQHIHPMPTRTPGLYSFTFTPKSPGGYRVWADITPKATGRQEFAMADLGAHRIGAVSKIENRTAVVSGYHFNLTFDTPPAAGGESVGRLTITGAHGETVTLEPVMGARAHIVGFYDDFRTVAHMHPMGDNPHEIMFHFAPDRAGFVKLFAQVEIGGKAIFAPFGVMVANRS